MKDSEITVKNKGYKDCFYFIHDILGYDKLCKRVHGPIIDFVNQDENQLLLLEPRGYYKTTTITIGWVIWRIIKNANLRIVINNKILSNARAFLREIKDHFKKNQLFRKLYGGYVGEIWRDDMITISKRTINHKEPTVSIGAIGHELTSGHYDIIVNDDIAGLPDMVSEAERSNTLLFYKSLKYVRDLQGTKEINIGTRWHLMDVYNHIMKYTPKECVRVRKAISDDGKLYFPEMQKEKDLKDEKDDDPILFEAQKQNNPTAMSDQLYALDKLKMYDYDAFKAVHNIAYIDPAFGKKERGKPCYLSFIIASIVNENIYIVEWHTNKNKPEDNEVLIIAKLKEYNIQQFAIETNAQQSEFARNIQKKINESKIALQIEWINNTLNKDRRIQSMHGTVTKNVYFRKDWETTYKESMSQLTLYPYHKFKDAPDALAGLVFIANKFQPDYGDNALMFEQKATFK